MYSVARGRHALVFHQQAVSLDIRGARLLLGHLRSPVAAKLGTARLLQEMADTSVWAPGHDHVFTRSYTDSLREMCEWYHPSRTRIPELYEGFFRDTLRSRSARPSDMARAAAADSPSTSRGTPSQHVVFSYQRSLGGDANPNDDDYARKCTWRHNRACWLFYELEQWNSLLAKGCFELLVHKCYELELVGFRCSLLDNPSNYDVFQTALLIIVLLQRHSCLTRVVVDVVGAKLERRLFWHAMAESKDRVRFLDLRADIYDGEDPVGHGVLWASSVSIMWRVVSLNLSGVLFNQEVSEALARYMKTTALESLSLTNITAEAAEVSHFLIHFAHNTSIKKLCLPAAFLSAQSGELLADAVRNHSGLEELEVRGSGLTSPSALLRGAVRNKTLRCLNIYSCQASLEDIKELAVALTRRPLSPSSSEGTSSESLTPTRRLERLGFFNFAKCDTDLERAYASLIGGVLLSLTLFNCHLTDTFGIAAALKLNIDDRLLKLNVAKNLIKPAGIYRMVEAMQVNHSLETLIVTILRMQPVDELLRLFSLIRTHGVSARLQFHWEEPRATPFAQGVPLCRLCTCEFALDRRTLDDATALMGTLSTTRHIRIASIKCTFSSPVLVIQTIIDAVRSARYLRHLTLNAYVRVPEMLKLVDALKSNRSVGILELPKHMFDEAVVTAMGQLVVHNRTIYILTIVIEDLKCKKQDVEIFRSEMSKAVPLNPFLIAVNLMLCNVNQETSFEVKQALRRNMMKVHMAVHFVNGSSDHSHVLAFRELAHTYSVEHVLSHNDGLDETIAAGKVIAARSRLDATS
ncbi:uncharacterized protein [Dermacentor albipictus]|uniref:uncharacterized protein isoform X2 n=1 Tax=Dermacentor albipictus TaxID=60249 RepID=UPI0038FD10CD